MLETIVRELGRLHVHGLDRRELCDLTSDIGRVRGALDALEVRLVAVVGALGDAGGDAESMLRSEGSARSERRPDVAAGRRCSPACRTPPSGWPAARSPAEHADDPTRAADYVAARGRLRSDPARQGSGSAGRHG